MVTTISIIDPFSDNSQAACNQAVLFRGTGIATPANITWKAQINSGSSSQFSSGSFTAIYTTPSSVANLESVSGDGSGIKASGVDTLTITVYDTGVLQDTRILVLAAREPATSETMLLDATLPDSMTAAVAPTSAQCSTASSQIEGVADAVPAVAALLWDPGNELGDQAAGCGCGGTCQRCSSGSGGSLLAGGVGSAGAGVAQAPSLLPPNISGFSSRISTTPYGLIKIKSECGILKSRGISLELCMNADNALDGLTPMRSAAGSRKSFGWEAWLVKDSAGNVAIYWGNRKVEAWRTTDAGSTFVAPKGVFGTLTKQGDGSFTRTTKNNAYYDFDSSGKLQTIKDRSSDSNVIYYNYNSAVSNFLVTRITGPGLSFKPYFSYDGVSGRASLMNLEYSSNPAYNRTTYYRYNIDGYMDQITGPENCITSLGVDLNGYLTQETNPDNYLTYFKYGAEAIPRVNEINFPTGQGLYFTYDDTVPRVSRAQAGGTARYFDYQWAGMPRSISNPGSAEVNYFDYQDANAKPTRAQGTDQNLSYFVWDSTGQVTAQKFTENFAHYFTYGSAGTVTSYKDPLGDTSYWNYDAQNYQTQWIDAKGNATYFERDSYGKMTSKKDRRGNVTYYTYDSRGNLTSIKQPDLSVRYFDYNPANELEVMIDALGNVAYYDHDKRGRVTNQKDFLGQLTQFGYDNRNNRTVMIDRRSNAWYWEYDGLSRLTRQRTALLNSTTFNYNTANLMTSQVDPLGNPTYFYYTSEKRLLARETALQERTYYTYTNAGQVQSVKDPLGCAQYFTYDTHHRQTSLKGGIGNVNYTNYDSADNVSNTIDPRGNQTTNTYDALNRLTATVDPLSQANYFYYDAESNQTCSEDALQRRTYYYFDSVNRQFCVEDPQVNRTYFTYEARGLRDSAKDARSNLSYFDFDKLARQFRTNDARGNTTTTYFDAESNTVAVTDPRVNTTYYTYDNDNRRSTVKTVLGEITTFGYDAAANQTSVVDALSRASYFYFDKLNRQFCGEDAKQTRTYYTFDASGNRNSIRDPLGRVTYFYFDCDNRNNAIMDALNGLVYYTFDKSSNRDSVKDQRANITYFDFDAISRMIRTKSAVGGVTAFGFDKAGNRTSVVDPLSRNNYFYFDSLNRLSASEDGLQKRTYFTYDAVSNQISIKNPRLGSEVGVQYFTYDALNRRNSFKNEVANVWYFDYDAASNLQTQINPLAALTYWHYDALNRQSLRKDPLNRQWSWSYDAVGNTSKMVDGKNNATYYYYDSVNLLTRTYYAADVVIHYYEYDSARQQTAMADQTGRTTFGYDNLGRMTSRVNPGSQALYYQFDAASNRTSLKDPDGFLFKYTFDASNRMTDATTAGYGLQPYGTSLYGGYATYYQYDLANEIVHERRVNTTVSYYGYDAAGRQSLIQHRKSDGTVIERFDYTRDEAGNIITQQADRVANTIYTYWNYDQANRVTKEAWRTSGGSDVYGFTYVYDAAGNRQSKTNVMAAATSYFEYDLADQTTLQRQGGTAKVYFTFDDDGNVSVEEDVDATAPKKTNYTYDQRNLLTQVAFPNNSPVTNYFYYNALSERTRKDDSTAQKKYTWDGIDVVVEKNLSNTTTQRLVKGYTMIPGIGAYAHQDVGAGNSLFPMKNQVGTTVRHTDPTQAVVNYYEYDAWGQPLEAHEANSQQYRFTGKEADPDAILVNVNNRRAHFPFRDYMPFRGMFDQADAVISRSPGGKTRLYPVTAYAYVDSCPTSYVDPDGLWKILKHRTAVYARAIAENGDTIKGLARLIGLDASEHQKWLQNFVVGGSPFHTPITEKQDVDKELCPGTQYVIPNSYYIFLGPEKLNTDEGRAWKTWFAEIWPKKVSEREYLWGSALMQNDLNINGHYVWTSPVGIAYEKMEDVVKGASRDKKLLGMLFVTHGNRESIFYHNDFGNLASVAPRVVAQEWIQYRVARVYTVVCYNFDKDWLSVVSPNGHAYASQKTVTPKDFDSLTEIKPNQ